MFKKIILTALLSAAVSQAAVKELIPDLKSDNLDTQTQARLDLLAVCSNAGKPDNEAERKAVCQEICKLLNGKLPEVTVMHQLLLNLERIGGAESVPTLVKLLNYRKPFIRDDARRALAVNPSKEAAQALGAQLQMRKMRPAKVTAGLITALGERRQKGASKLILGYLTHKDDILFMAAVKALGRLNEKDGIRALTQARSKAEGFRKIQIDAALFSSGNPSVFEQLYTAGEPDEVRATALLGLLLQGQTDLAAPAMASHNPAQQVAVIEAAIQGKEPKIYDVVAANIGTLPPHIQLQALGALEFSGNRAYAKSVNPLLTSGDWLVQDNACSALARIGTAESVPALLANGSSTARRALGLLNVDGVDTALERAAAGGEDKSRSVAIDALAIRGRTDLIPAFFKYAAEDGKETSKAAAKAIGAIGDLSNLKELTELMIAREKSPISRDLLLAGVAIMRRSTEPAKAVDILVAQMGNVSPRSKANILQALMQTGSKEALAPIVKECTSNDEKLRKQAIKLLGSWQNVNAVPTLLNVAGDDSLSLANHVVLMRGVSRLLAAQSWWKFDFKVADQALATCRRDEEKASIQATIDKVKAKK